MDERTRNVKIESRKENFDNDTDESCSQLRSKPGRNRKYSEKSLTASYDSSYAGSLRAVSPYGPKATEFGPFLPVVLCILFTELCERMTYYGISGNLLVFLNTDLQVDSALASSIVLAFTGLSYVVPLFGGWIADSIAGKFNTLYGSVLIYFVGTALLPVVAYKFKENLGPEYEVSNTVRYVFFAISLIFVSFGTGGIKANVSPFGADQIQSLGPSAISVFFNWFYWFINVGSLVAYTGIVYLQVQKSFFYGYLVPLAGIFLATLILLSGRKRYICKPPNGSVLTDLCKIMHSATKRRWRLWRAGTLQQNTDMGWLDYARIRYGGRYSNGQVDTLISLLRILPIFATMILYWTVYNQMQTSFLLQGLSMDLKIGRFTIPAASLSLFDVIVILVLIPLMDRIVFPLLKKYKLTLSPLKRMGAGMVFAILSVIVAATLEVKRRDNLSMDHNKISGKNYRHSNLTVFYQAPQYLLIGTSEVFASISGLEFAYAQSPRVLQGVVMGLFLVTSGLGALFGSVLVQIVQSVTSKHGVNWYNNDINEGRLNYFFYLLAALLGVNFLVFCVIAMRFTYVSDDVLRKNEDEWVKHVQKRDADMNQDDDGYVTTHGANDG